MTAREKPLGLDMPFNEAFERLLGVDPAELSRSMAEKGEPPERPPGVDDKDEPPAT